MAEVLVSYEQPVRDTGGVFHARAVGRRANDGMWEGWLEFVPIDGDGEVLVTAAESRQPERGHLEYWATGLTPVYLEGALQRARRPITVRVSVTETPASASPARSHVVTTVAPRAAEPVLDPFEVGSRSLDVLKQELRALNRPRLTNIIAAYELNPAKEDVGWMTDAQLAHFIVTAVETRLVQRGR